MTRSLRILRAGPGLSVQDTGRPGHLAHGVSRGGAADLLALAEGAALLNQSGDLAALELVGPGTIAEATDAPLRIALTGAPMQVSLSGEPIAWNASHLVHPGQRLTFGPARKGTFGYLHVGGGIATDPILGSRSAHLAAGLGDLVKDGDTLPIGKDPGGTVNMTLDSPDRFSGGTVHIVPSVQTDRFDTATRDRFESTTFRRDPRSNRMGVRLKFDGDGFSAKGQLNVLSEVIVPGDIQITGDGTPIVLMGECQTTGGYPRIGTVLPCDMPRIAQAAPDAELIFRFISRDRALALHRAAEATIAHLPKTCRPLIRDPADISDLLSYQLVGGVISALDPQET